MSRHLADAARDLHWLTQIWHHYHDARLKGSPRYWLGTARTRGRRQQATTDPDTTVHGKPAPLNLDVYDALTDLNHWADETSDAIANLTNTARPQLAYQHPEGGWADPSPRLAYIATQLRAVDRAEHDLAASIAYESGVHARRAQTILGLARDGHQLAFPCPYCGHQQLTVRKPDDNRPALIVCYGPPCKADENHAGHHTFAGRRAWPQPWDNLARMVTGYAPGDVGTLAELASEANVPLATFRTWVQRDGIKPVGQNMSGYPIYMRDDFRQRLASEAQSCDTESGFAVQRAQKRET